MENALITKLGHGCQLNEDDRAKLRRLTRQPRSVLANTDIIHQGEGPQNVHLVLDGIACRYKTLAEGQRQIVAFLLPGDFCDLHVAILGAMDHSIATLTNCAVVDIPRTTIEELTATEPRITRALWWATLVDEAVLREWLASMGGRPADQQLAHFFCELLIRLQAAGRADDQSYAMPLTQEDMADALGLSTVHLNRSLQKLRSDGLIRLEARHLTVLDRARLERLAGFDPSYLHLRQRSFTH